ncbi:MAG: 4-hydroxythreonine-4-phosphate dehydrogenase PdxA, partial [Chthoniobacterales bacterium]
MTKKIAITLGDPAGIGPEVVRAALERPEIRGLADFEIIGSDVGFTPGSPCEAGARAAFDSLEEAVERAKAGEFGAVVTGPVSKKWLHSVGFD